MIIAPILTEEMRQEVNRLLLLTNPNSLTTIFKFECDGDFSFEQFLIWLQDHYLMYKGGSGYKFLAYYKDETEFIPVGFLALDELKEEKSKGVNTCLYIAETYQGKGFGTDLTVAGIQWILKRSDYNFIETNILPTNAAATKIFKNLGFTVSRKEWAKYLEDFTDSSFKKLSEDEQSKIFDSPMKLIEVDIEYYRRNLR